MRIKSVGNEHSQDIDADIDISQSWSRMAICMTGLTSDSRSVIASLRVTTMPTPELVYVFLNEPRADAPARAQMFYGTTTLSLSNGGQTLTGHYYTGRGRSTYGTMLARRAVPHAPAVS